MSDLLEMTNDTQVRADQEALSRSQEMRVLVTGSRTWTDWQFVWDKLDEAAPTVVVHGGNPKGGDAMAEAWAARHGVPPEVHPADWEGMCRPTCRPGHRRTGPGRGTGYCPAAGDYRNQEMVDLGADLVLAFILDDSRGASDCLARAEQALLNCRVFRWYSTTMV